MTIEVAILEVRRTKYESDFIAMRKERFSSSSQAKAYLETLENSGKLEANCEYFTITLNSYERGQVK